MNPLASLVSLNSKLDRAIEFSKIDLGRKLEQLGCWGAVGQKSPVTYYPSLYIDGKSKLELPDAGKATVDFKVTRRSVEIVDGKEFHSATVEVRAIEPAEIAKKKKLDPSVARPIKMFSRARDTYGQFAPQGDDGSPDPNTMAKAYGPGAIAKSAAATGGGIGAGLLLSKLLNRKKLSPAIQGNL